MLKDVWSKRFGIFAISVLLLVPQVADAQASLPNCTINCLAEIKLPPACATSLQQCICDRSPLLANLTACVRASCTVEELLTSSNITASECEWPRQDQSELLQVTAIVFFVITTVFVAARVIARLPILGSTLGPDDWLIVLIWSLVLAYTVVVYLDAEAGVAKEIWAISFAQVTKALKLSNILQRLNYLTVWLAKISILLLYLRLFPDETLRRWVKVGIVLCSVTLFCLFWANFFDCWPISYQWTFWDNQHQGSCADIKALTWAGSVLSMVGDLVILLLPQPTLWRMNLSLEKKLSVILAFSVGLFVTIVSVIRLKVLQDSIISINITGNWQYVEVIEWTTIEMNVGVICACMPGMRNFYTRVIRGKWMKNLGPMKSTPSPGSSGASSQHTGFVRKVFRPQDESVLMETRAIDTEEKSSRASQTPTDHATTANEFPHDDAV